MLALIVLILISSNELKILNNVNCNNVTNKTTASLSTIYTVMGTSCYVGEFCNIFFNDCPTSYNYSCGKYNKIYPTGITSVYISNIVFTRDTSCPPNVYLTTTAINIENDFS